VASIVCLLADAGIVSSEHMSEIFGVISRTQQFHFAK